MVLFPRGETKGDRSLDRRWVEKGRTARQTTTGLDEWSDREIQRWDLDDPERTPTGEWNPRTYEYDKPLDDVLESDPDPDSRGRVDIRERYDR